MFCPVLFQVKFVDSEVPTTKKFNADVGELFYELIIIPGNFTETIIETDTI